MVVSNDDCGGPVGYRISKNLPGVNLGFVYQTNGNNPVSYYFVGAV